MGRFRGLAREQLYFLGNDGEAQPGVSVSRGLDSGIQGEQVGLARYPLDR